MRVAAVLLLAAAPGGATRLYAEKAATPPATATVGNQGWQLIDAAPPAGAGGSSAGTDLNTMMWEVSRNGVADMPVSDAQKDLLNQAFDDDPDGPDDVIFMSQELLAAMESSSFPAGYEQYIDTTSIASESGQVVGKPSLVAGNDTTISLSVCSWTTDTKNKTVEKTHNALSRDIQFGSGIDGHLGLSVPLETQAQIGATYKIRKCLGVPVGFKFVSATASVSAKLSGSGDLDATVSAATPPWSHEWPLGEPKLGEVEFMVAWVPVRFVFTLPVSAGASFSAKVTGRVTAGVDASASGSYSYTCTTSTCSGGTTFDQQFKLVAPTASATADLKAQVYALVKLKVSIYEPHVAHVEGGVKVYSEARMWGYAGNGCGDADGDGTPEIVTGLSADLVAGYQFTYGMGGWVLPDKTEYTSAHEVSLGWQDLLGHSSALQPMLTGPGTPLQGAAVEYTVAMRPCYPYTHNVNFTVDPSTWVGPRVLVSPPGGTAKLQGNFANSGAQSLCVKATTDAFGRDLDSRYCRDIGVTATAPTAPSGLVATLASPTTAHLAWTDASNNETGFEVERRLSPSGAFVLVGTVGSGITTFDDAGLLASTAYDYHVRATNAVGPSAFSSMATVTTAPAAPTGLNAVFGLVTRTVVVTWNDESSNEQGFQLQYSFAGSPFADFATVGANVTSFTSVANPPLGSYQLRVRSFSGAVGSDWSNVASVTVTPPALAVCSTPPGPAWVTVGDTPTWTPCVTGGDPATTQFAFFRRRPGTSTWIPDPSAPAWQTSHVLGWTTAASDVGVWEVYFWVKDATTPPTANTNGFAVAGSLGVIEVRAPLAVCSTPPGPGSVTVGDTITWTPCVTGGDPASTQFALFRRRTGTVTWFPDPSTPTWQTSHLLSWTPAAGDVGVWEVYFWVKDATTPPSANTNGFAVAGSLGAVEVRTSMTACAGTASASSAAVGYPVAWYACASGGDPATTKFALFRRRAGTAAWSPDPNAPAWQSSNVFTWTSTPADAGPWEVYFWVKDASTPANANTYGYAAGRSLGILQVIPTPPITCPGSASAGSVAFGSPVSWTACVSGGDPATTRFALFRRRAGTAAWSPDPNAPAWQSSSAFTWTPNSADTGSWEIYFWVKDGSTRPGDHNYGYADGRSLGVVEVTGVAQAYPPTGWVDGYNTQHIWGWACDPDYPTESNRVDIWGAGGQSFGSGAAELGSSATINGICRGGTAHYFDYYPGGGMPSGTHFSVWSIDLPYATSGNDNRRLGGTGSIGDGTEFVIP